MESQLTNPLNSLHVIRAVRRCEEHFGERLLQHLGRRLAGENRDVTNEDIHNALADAYSDYREAHSPNEERLAASFEDVENGRHRPLRELLNEVQSRNN